MKKLIFLAIACIMLAGCAQTPLQTTKFTPQNDRMPVTTPYIPDLPLYYLYSDPSLEVSANIYEYNNMLTLFIIIKNKTKENLLPENYSISLTDGRDYKEIKMLSRQDLINIRSKYIDASNGSIQDQVIEATMTNAMKVANMPTKEKLAELITLGVNNYFSFRPVYPNEVRQGVLCFLPDFKLEYPLTIFIKIKSKNLAFHFLPVTK